MFGLSGGELRRADVAEDVAKRERSGSVAESVAETEQAIRRSLGGWSECLLVEEWRGLAARLQAAQFRVACVSQSPSARPLGFS